MKKVINIQSLAGLSATFIGNGIGRFAYIALIPLLIEENWFSKQESSYLGVCTLLGYLIGSYLCKYFTKCFNKINILRYSMLLCSLSNLLCLNKEIPIELFYIFRLISGITGALLMIIAPSFILPKFNNSIRGKVSGIVFSGIGLGILFSGSIIPLLSRYGVSITWSVIGMVSLILTAFFWNKWDGNDCDLNINNQHSILTKQGKLVVFLICVSYIMNAIGYLPHTLFWTDYIANELKFSLNTASFFWMIFGIGAFIGPMITGFFADLFGLKNTLIISFLIKSFAVSIPIFSSSYLMLFISSLFVGIFTPGTASLVSAYTLQCVDKYLHHKYWGIMTFSFAISQVMVGYLMTVIANKMNSYQYLFNISTISLLLSAILILSINSKNKELYEIIS